MAITQPFPIYPKQASVDRKQANRRVLMPAPIGGWNTRDTPTNMQPQDAVKLINMIPRQGYVEMRGGYESYSLVESNTGVENDTANYLDGGDIAAFDFGATQDFSVEFWIKHPGNTGTARILGKRATTGAGWAAWVNETTEDVSFVIDDGTNVVTATLIDACPNDSAYHFCAFTVDRTNDQIRGYAGNSEDTTSGSPFSIASVTGSLSSSGSAAFRIFANGDLSESLAPDSLTITEYAPTPSVSGVVNIAAGNLAITAQAPSVAGIESPAADALALTEYAPTATTTGMGASIWNGGIIDEVRIWNDVRTAQEISDNYQQEVSADASLIGYWKMQGLVGASVTTVADSSGNSNTLTDVGAGDITYVDSSSAFSRDADIDLCVEFDNGASRVLLTATATNIYDSSASGVATSKGSGFTSGRWDTAMLGGIMALVNGADTPQQFNGTTLSTLTCTGSGLTATNLIGVHTHKAKSYFWEDDSQDFWYSATNALGGALTKFPLGDVAKTGGRLLRMMSWTVDGGSGPDDYAVFIMSSGEVIIYQGSDPGSALYWNLVGIYNIGEPINDRAFTRYGREIMGVVQNDIVMLPSAFAQQTPPVSKLAGAITDAVANYDSNDGWEVFWYPNESLMMVNVPVALSPDTFEQYVLNVETMAACRFTGIPARTWGMFNGNAYFGSTDGTVYRYNTVQSDASSDIDCTAMTAWTSMGTFQNVMLTGLRPTFACAGSFAYDMRAGYDFNEPSTSSPSSSVSTGTPWGSAWGSSWGPVIGESIVQTWRMSSGRGAPVTTKLQFSRQGDKPKWYKTDALVRVEGNL